MPILWQTATVTKIQELSPTIKSFALTVNGLSSFHFEEGQFLTFDLPVGTKRLERWKSYSIASAPNGTSTIELCISKVEGGKASTYFFEEVTVGTILSFKGPDGSFVLPSNAITEIVMVCTGTGIAPFRSMLLGIGQRFLQQHKITLIFGGRTQKDLIYRAELEALEKEYPNFRYIPTLSREDWNGHQGYVHQWYAHYFSEVLSGRAFLLCGWSKMVDEAVANLKTMGYDNRQIIVELYG